MNISDLEKKMRRAFLGERHEVNTDDLWAAIESELPKSSEDNRRTRWPIYLGILLLFLVGTFGVIITSSSDNLELKKGRELVESRQIYDDLESYDTEQEKGDLIDNFNTDQTNITNESNITLIENPIHQLDAIVEFDQGNSDPLVETNVTSPFNAKSRSDQSLKGRFLSVKKDYAQGGYANYYSEGEEYQYSSNMTKDPNQHSIINGGRPLNTSRAWSDKSTSLTGDNILQSHSYEYSFYKGLLSQIEIDEMDFTTRINKIPSMEEKHPFGIEKERKVYFEIGAIGLMRMGSLSLIDMDWTDHYNNRKSAENNLLSFALDSKIGYKISEELSVYSGVIWSHYSQRSSATVTSVEEVVLENGLVQEIVGVNGIQEIRGAVQATRMTTSTVSRINEYKFLHIPIGINWTKNLGLVQLTSGIEGRLGISSSYTGFLHPVDTEEYSIIADTERWYDSGNPHFIGVHTGVQYPLSDVISIGMSAQYQHQIKGFNSSTYGISENLSSIGLRTNIQFNF